MNEYKLITLENGLRLILVPRTGTEVVTVMAMFGVGSRNEANDIAGISHVLEHMHYKGTKKRSSAIKLSEYIESIGAEHNAFTGKEYTGYYVKAMPKHLSKVFDFISDQLLDSLFDANELEKEKNVIIQEIQMYEDLPMEMVGNYFERTIFGDNSLGRDIIGSPKSVKSVTREKLIEYRDNFYQGQNTVVVIAGNFGGLDETKIKEMVEQYFVFSKGKTAGSEEITIGREKKNNIIRKKTEQSHVIVGFETVSLNHPDYFKLELLATILGGSMSSRMFEEIREKRGLAYAVRTSTINYIESGALYTQAGVLHEKVLETIGAILNEYEKIKLDEIADAELQKAKEITLGRMLIKMEDSEEIAHHFASEALLAEKILTTEEIKKAYQSVTTSDILEVAKKYLIREKMGVSFIGPEIDEEKLKTILNLGE